MYQKWIVYINTVNFYISKLDMDAHIKCGSRSRKRKTIGIHPDPVVTMTITEYRSFTFISVKITPVLAYIQTMQRRVLPLYLSTPLHPMDQNNGWFFGAAWCVQILCRPPQLIT